MGDAPVRNAIVVIGHGGLRGTVEQDKTQVPGDDRVSVRFETLGHVLVPTELMELQEDGSFFLPMSAADIERYREENVRQQTSPIVLPVVEEELHVGRRRVETGKVRVHTTVQEHEEVVDEPQFSEEVEVQRVAVNRFVDQPQSTRQEDDVLIVPLHEEVLVIERKIRLREELHIRRRRIEEHQPQRITLRREEAHIERIKPDET